MFRVKASPVVITTLLLLMLILVAPAAATTRQAEGSEDLARFAHFDTRSATLCTRRSRASRRRPAVSARIDSDVQLAGSCARIASLIRMNRSLARLSRRVLEPESD